MTLGVLLAVAGLAEAGTISWTNTAGGFFQDAGNWVPNTVPGTNDVAVFDVTSTPYTVIWNNAITNSAFKVNQGTVTWDLQGNTYTYRSTTACSVGVDSFSTVSLTITNGAVTNTVLNEATPTRIKGTGTVIRVRNAYVQLNYPYLDHAGTTLMVEGPTAVWAPNCKMPNMIGTMIVTNGARLSVRDELSIETGSVIRISGSNSILVAALFTINPTAEGSVLVSSGGTLSSLQGTPTTVIQAGTAVRLENGFFRMHYGTGYKFICRGTIEGTGITTGVWQNCGGQALPGGTNGIGLLAHNGAFQNYDTNNPASQGSIDIELGGQTSNQFDRLCINGKLWASGTLNVKLINGFQPVSNDIFKILSFTSVTGSFSTLNLPTHVPWETSNLYTKGEITLDAPGLGTPANVAASDSLYSDKITVTWAAVSGATGYTLWRSTSTNFGEAIRIGETPSPSYDDTTMVLSTTNWYWVMATNATKLSALSGGNDGYASGINAPSDLTASDSLFTNKITVTWSPPPGASGYQVWRARSPSFAAATYLGSSASSPYEDYAIAVGMTNWYWVRGTNTTHVSPFVGPDSGVAVNMLIVSDFSNPAAWTAEAGNPGFNSMGTLGVFLKSAVVDSTMGSVTELTLTNPPTDPTKINMQCVYLQLNNPITIPFPSKRIGLWVKGNSSWGRVNFMFTDANGEIFKTVIDFWARKRTDHRLAINFDDWCFISQELPLPETDDYRNTDIWLLKARTDINNTWDSSGGDGIAQYPLTVSRIAIGLRNWQVYVTNMIPATSRSIRLGKFMVGD